MKLINGKYYSKGFKQFVRIDKVVSAGLMCNPSNGLENLIIFNMENSAPMGFAFGTAKEASAAWLEFCTMIGDDIEIEINQNVITLLK